MAKKRTRPPTPPKVATPSPGEPGIVPVPPPPTGKAKGWEGLSDEEKLHKALRHFGIKKADILSYRVYPHKVAIVYGYGQKVEYWPEG